jgi:hypothetical protein
MAVSLKGSGPVRARPFRLAAAFVLLGGLAAPAWARAIIKVAPASVSSDLSPLLSPTYFFSSYRVTLLDLAAGAEISDVFALAGGAAAVEYTGYWWSYSWSYHFDPPTTVLPLPVYAYVLMSPPDADDNSRLRSYLLLGAYPLAIPKYHAIAGTGGLGASWTFYAVTVGAEFRALAWRERYQPTRLTYVLQLTFGAGGWYAVGSGGDEAGMYP